MAGGKADYGSPLAAIEFKRRNPITYELLAGTAIDLRRQGKRVSISRVFEEVREENTGEINAVPFKLNNSMGAAMARLLMADYPELEGAFETRKAASDGYDFKAAMKDNDNKEAAE